MVISCKCIKNVQVDLGTKGVLEVDEFRVLQLPPSIFFRKILGWVEVE